MTADKKRVLVVDDEPQVLELICALLVRFCVVEKADSMEAMLDALAVSRKDVTVLDLRLPDSTMVQTVARIRELKAKGAGRVVAITSVPLTDDWVEMIGLAGADELVEKMKPYFGERLVKAVG